MEEENIANMRVQLIKHPMLKSLDRRSVEEWDNAYEEYKQQLESQGSRSAQPIAKSLCIPRELREVISMENGVAFKDLSDETINEYLEELRDEEVEVIQVDLQRVFKGVRMDAPRNPSDIDKRISEFFKKINERKNWYSLNERFLNGNDTEVGKQSFPRLIEGIWPPPASVFLEKKWKRDGRRWTLQKMLQEIKEVVKSYGAYELIRSQGSQKPQESRTYAVGQADPKRTQNKKRRTDSSKPPLQGNETTRKSTDRNLVCFKCGEQGHIRPECRLKDDHPKVIAYRRSRSTQRLKKLTVRALHENEDVYSVDSDA